MSPAFDLDSFAPPPVSFTFRGQTWTVFGDPVTDQITRMLRIETALSEADGIDETLDVVAEGCKILTDLAHDYDADQPDVQLSAQALLVTFALILHGSSVAAAVAEAISRPTQGGDDAGNAVATAREHVHEGERDVDADPLASARSSSERSSTSDGFVDGLLATGSG